MIYNSNKYYCKTNRCADFGGTKWNGKSYVYVWMDENNIPFYVGSGSGNRATSVTGSRRSREFIEKVKDGCWVWFVAENVNPRFVFEIERQTVLFFVNKGINLCQKAYTDAYKKYGSTIPIKVIKEMCNAIWEDMNLVRQHEPILKDGE